MKRNNSGFARIIFIALTLAAIFAVIILSSSNSEPTVTFSASILPLDAIKVGEEASLNLKFSNEDLNSHDISVVIEANPRVSVYSGDELLSTNQYSFTIDSGDPEETRILALKATLESGTSDTTYDIGLSLYVDGDNVQETTLHLKVES